MAFCTTCGANVDGAFCAQCGTPVSVAQTPPPVPNAPPPHIYAPQPIQPGIGMAPPPPVGAPRRMSPVVLVLLIVFGFFFVCILGLVGFGFFAARAIRNNPGAVIAKILTAGNPNVEVLNTDNGAGTITIRDRRTGKESTITFDQARNGRFSITANDDRGGHGSVQFGGDANDLPSWVPKYPGAINTGVFSAKGTDGNGNGEGGSFTFTTSDPPRKVLDFYRDKAGELGLKVNLNTDTGSGGMIVAAEEGEKRSLMATANAGGASTTVSITYGEKR
ncbi:MAG: zinc ribbon domain-containing protein [Bryobacteraceae bacterium]